VHKKSPKSKNDLGLDIFSMGCFSLLPIKFVVGNIVAHPAIGRFCYTHPTLA